MEIAYDFIVVGGGASGCVVASRLANSPGKPSVLLLEAGGTNKGVDHLSGAERFAVAFKPGSQLNWGYKTVPQFEQEIDYSRGKGLGGSTAINFCGWVIGADEDYNEWARLIDDNSFAWPHVKQCLQRIERLHPETPAAFDHHILPKAEDHGVHGAIDVAYGAQWLTSTKDVFEAAKQSGFHLNPDVNSGNPIGMGIGTACIYKGKRITASSAYLSGPPDNLTIRTNSLVGRILISDDMATGVETVDGEVFEARHEVIVSGGAVNSPQLLLLSGIGPAEDLAQHGIEVVRDLPQVGRNLQDHCFSSAGVVLKRQSESSPRKQSPSPMGWFKLNALNDSAELQSLPDAMKVYLTRPTVPHWELATNTPFFDGEAIEADEEVFSAICLVMNPQSRGTVTLRSADPTDAPLIDPNFLSHPFDRKVISEALREMMRYFQAPVFSERTVRRLGWPASDSNDAILDQCKSNLRSSWHACGTIAMGRDVDTACVDSNFKVFGLRKLRVADMSVCPLIPNNHTQSTAYVVGEIMAEKLIAEYGLDRLP